jgi:hypothetical protein
MEKTGRVLDGSAFAEETIAVYENREAGYDGRGVKVSRKRIKAEDREYILIEPAAFPTLGIRASVPGADHRIILESLEFLSPNRDGWNEFSRELSGEGRFTDDWHSGFLTVKIAPEVLDISSGRIRRGGSRITGNEALTALRNRQERIDVLAAWMATYLEAREPFRTESGRAGRSFADQDEFEEFWEPVLFPETVPAKKRPPAWAATAELQRDEQGSPVHWLRGEDINWSVDYTGALFPEETAALLQPVRNSGTMLRDWEEALPWIFYQFEWNAIMASLSQEIRLSKVR